MTLNAETAKPAQKNFRGFLSVLCELCVETS